MGSKVTLSQLKFGTSSLDFVYKFDIYMLPRSPYWAPILNNWAEYELL